MRLADFDAWAADHHGLLTLAASGLTNDAWHRARRAGSLIAVHRHVARLPGSPVTPVQRIHAAVLAADPTAVASHHSAALLWGLVTDERPSIHITSRAPTRHLRLDGVVIHRPRDRRRLAPQRRAGIACTDPLRTLCDLGACDPDLVDGAVGRALTARLVDLDALTIAVIEHGRQGRRGIPALRAAVREWTIDHRPADSVLETAFRDLARRYGLPPSRFHERIAGWEVDFRFVDTPVIVECDGWSTHGLDRDQFERDRRKDTDLAIAGWHVVRISYRSIIEQPADTAARLRRVLDRWTGSPVPAVS